MSSTHFVTVNKSKTAVVFIVRVLIVNVCAAQMPM